MKEVYVKRYKNNPILTKDDIPYQVETVHNAGVVKYNGKYIMLFRSHKATGRSIIGIAESNDGFNDSEEDIGYGTNKAEKGLKEIEGR